MHAPRTLVLYAMSLLLGLPSTAYGLDPSQERLVATELPSFELPNSPPGADLELAMKHLSNILRADAPFTKMSLASAVAQEHALLERFHSSGSVSSLVVADGIDKFVVGRHLIAIQRLLQIGVAAAEWAKPSSNWHWQRTQLGTWRRLRMVGWQTVESRLVCASRIHLVHGGHVLRSVLSRIGSQPHLALTNTARDL